jgi:hypothetical protein
LSLASQQLILFPLKSVVIYKKILDLVQPLGGKILQPTDVGIHVVHCVLRWSGPLITVMMGPSRSEATLDVFCLSDAAHMNQEKRK